MRLRLPHSLVAPLSAALERAGRNETGGQMFGEQISSSDFRVTDLTFQRRPGTLARFVVDLVQATRDALAFFQRTGHRYARYNYIGEWHSHPSFEVRPSSTDLASMRSIVGDPDFRGRFAVLMIVRLDGDVVTCGAWLFDPHGREEPVTIELNDG